MKTEPFRAYKQDGTFVVTSNDRKRFEEHLAQFGDGEDMALTLDAWEDRRSLKANAAFHACLTEWCRHKAPLADSREIRAMVETMKDDLLALQFGYIVRQNLFTGEIIKALAKPHTSQLTTSEFCDLFDLAAVQAAEDHFVMTMPDEYKRAKAAAAKKAERDARKAQKAA